MQKCHPIQQRKPPDSLQRERQAPEDPEISQTSTEARLDDESDESDSLLLRRGLALIHLIRQTDLSPGPV